jgi:hypothetical protein
VITPSSKLKPCDLIFTSLKMLETYPVRKRNGTLAKIVRQ